MVIHIQLHHGEKQRSSIADELTEKMAEWKQRKAEKSETRKIQSKQSQQNVIPYAKSDSKYKQITRKLAIYIGACSIPNSTVRNSEFSELMFEMDPKYKLPSVSALSKEIDAVFLEMRAKIQCYMSKTKSINFCTDIWTKKGMTSSYLGITAHFYIPATSAEKSLKTAALAVKQMEGSITGLAIRQAIDDVFKEWDIQDKVNVVVTDNGSNMIRAFKEHLCGVEGAEEDEEEGGDCQELDEGEDGQAEHGLALEEDEHGQVLDAEALDDISADVDPDYLEDIDIDEELREFENNEQSIGVAFHGLKRLSCFPHTIQLVVAKFVKDKKVSSVLKRVFAMVKSFNKSKNATEELVKKAGVKLVGRCPTRWSSTFLVIKRLLRVQEPLRQILAEREQDAIQPSDWKLLKEMHELLFPFAQMTTLTSGETYVTLSKVIPCVLLMKSTLKKHVDNRSSLSNVAKNMIKEVDQRFGHLLDPDHPDHDPVYAVATFFDRRYKTLLRKELLASTKKAIVATVRETFEGVSDNDTDSDLSPTKEPPNKRPCVDPLTAFVDEFEMHTINTGPVHTERGRRKSITGRLNLAVDEYEGVLRSSDADPLEYWISKSDDLLLGTLAPYAINTLSIPVSSAPVERVFSVAGESTIGKRNRLTGSNLEREVLLRKNKSYYT